MNEEMTNYVNQKVESSILKELHGKRARGKGSFDFWCVEEQLIRRAKRSLRVMRLK